MSEIVSTGSPQLTYKKEVRARINCPNCNEVMHFDPTEVDIGNIVKCDKCEKLTYYPFEKPWYRKTKVIVGFIFSNIVAFIIGILVNYAYTKVFVYTMDSKETQRMDTAAQKEK